MESKPSKQFVLKATYTSPANAPFTRELPLPAPSTASTKERVMYLGALRKATVNLQEQINKEMTERMEEDKSRDVSRKGKGATVDDKKEEENYGEEVVEED